MWFVKWIFWGSLVFIAYAYVGYLLALLVLSCFRNRPVLVGDIQPRVSFVITAYNEEARIKERLRIAFTSSIPLSALKLLWHQIARQTGPTTSYDRMRLWVCGLCVPRNEEAKKRLRNWRSVRRTEKYCSGQSQWRGRVCQVRDGAASFGNKGEYVGRSQRIILCRQENGL